MQKPILWYFAEPMCAGCRGFSAAPQAFQMPFEADELRALTRAHFKHSRPAGVQGFPTLIWQHGKQIETLCRGYLSQGDMTAMLKQRLADIT